MTGHDRGPRQGDLARLRAFCLLNSVLFLVVAGLVAFARLLLGELVDDTATAATPLFAQEMLCAALLVVLAALLLWMRARLPQAAGREALARVGQTVRTVALLVAAACVAGAAVVLLVSTADSKSPTVMISGLTVVFALYTYAGGGRLRSS